MQIFNNGARIFTTPFGNLHPRKLTPVPVEHEASASLMLKKYPNELLPGGPGEAALVEKETENKRLASDNTTLKDQLAKLQQLVASSEGAEKIAELENALAAAQAEVEELKAKLARNPKNR